MKYYYFKDNTIIEFDFELTENYYNVGYTYQDFIEGKYVKLTEEQIQFKINYPEASIKEIWDTKLNTQEIIPDSTISIKGDKVRELTEYLETIENTFILNSKEVWINLQDRMLYMYLINVYELLGKVVINLEIGGVEYKLTTEKAKELVSSIELYSIDCSNVFNSKLKEIENSNDIDYIKNYNVKDGFPEMLQFTF